MSTKQETKAEKVAAIIAHAMGTEDYHRFNMLFRKHVLTDSALLVAQEAGAHWLMEAIASHHRTAMRDPMLQDIQFWTLKVNQEDSSAVLTCERDKDDVVITQEIPYTDFPLEEIKLYVQPLHDGDGHYVIMLPGDY
jgi:hypothetical protein